MRNEAHELVAERRVLILGDSWVHGVSLERRSTFGKQIAIGIGASEILDLSGIGRTAPEIVTDHLDQISEFRPTVTLLNIGGADSLVFPPSWMQRVIDRYAPPSWHGERGMQPRAVYSKKRSRRIRQRTEHVVKACVKQFAVNVFGGEQRVPLDDFEQAARTILGVLSELGGLIVVIGIGPIENFASPKSNKRMGKANEVMVSLCTQFPRTFYVPTTGLAHRWDDYLADRVHLNSAGHGRVAAGILGSLKKAAAPWGDLVRENELIESGR